MVKSGGGVYEVKGEWGGCTIRQGCTGWIVSTWTRVIGSQTGWRYLIPYSEAPRGLTLGARINEYGTTEAERLLHVLGGTTSRVLRRGHIVR
ncbi:MAG: hypothetical protein ACRDHF_13370 [Tepidiformaceae bacterium]